MMNNIRSFHCICEQVRAIIMLIKLVEIRVLKRKQFLVVTINFHSSRTVLMCDKGNIEHRFLRHFLKQSLYEENVYKVNASVPLLLHHHIFLE